MISVRSLQRSEGDVSDPIKYIYSGNNLFLISTEFRI